MFTVGNFVLVARCGAQARGNKIATPWTGLARVVDHKGNSGLVFVAHLPRYSDKQLRVAAPLFDHVAHAGYGHVISAIIGHWHRLTPTPQLHVSWEGHSDAEDTWEPVASIVSDRTVTLMVWGPAGAPRFL